MAKLKSGTRIYGTATVDTSVSVGSGVTISGNGINVSGVVTATSFSGSGSNLTGIVTSIVAGTNVTISGSTGQVTINASVAGGGGTSQWVTTSAGIHTLSNVGIGTTNPTSRLTVSGDARVSGVVTAMTFSGQINAGVSTLGITTTTGLSATQLSISGVSTFAGITTVTGTTLFSRQLNVSGISTLGITTTAGLSATQLSISGVSTFAGITTVTGTTLFSRQLNVSGVSTFNNTLNVVPTSTGIAGLFSGTTSSDMVRITQLGTGNAFVVEDDTNPDASPFVIDATGNVGVGTITPSTVYKLNVHGSTNAYIQVTNDTEGFGPTRGLLLGYDSSGNRQLINSWSLPLVLNTSVNAAPVVIQPVSSRRVGIGSTLPNNKLDVIGSAYVSGNVGVGTTNPTQPLHVNGNLRISGGLYVGLANTSGTSGQVLQSTGTGVTWVSGGGGLTGIKSDGTVIASGVTINTLDFTGSGITSVSYDSATSIASIDIRGTERRSQSFTATSNQTTFTITNGYTPGYVDVYLNGSKLQESAEFTATDGSTVVLTSGATANDIIDVVSFFLGVYSNPNYTTTRSVTRTVATASQTSFSVSYDVGYVDVYLNGSKLDSTEFTATTGSTVVLATPATVNDVLEFISYATLSVNTIDTTVVNETTNATRYITFTDVTSGSISTARVSSSGLTFNPSTGSFGTQNIDATKVTLTQGINATGIVTATGGFVGNVTGNVTGNLTGTASNATNATSAGTATTATNANNVNVSNEASDTTCYPVFVTTATGNQAPKTNTGFYFDSATGTLYATKFSGDGSLLTGITASDITLDAMLFGA